MNFNAVKLITVGVQKKAAKFAIGTKVYIIEPTIAYNARNKYNAYNSPADVNINDVFCEILECNIEAIGALSADDCCTLNMPDGTLAYRSIFTDKTKNTILSGNNAHTYYTDYYDNYRYNRCISTEPHMFLSLEEAKAADKGALIREYITRYKFARAFRQLSSWTINAWCRGDIFNPPLHGLPEERMAIEEMVAPTRKFGRVIETDLKRRLGRITEKCAEMDKAMCLDESRRSETILCTITPLYNSLKEYYNVIKAANILAGRNAIKAPDEAARAVMVCRSALLTLREGIELCFTIGG